MTVYIDVNECLIQANRQTRAGPPQWHKTGRKDSKGEMCVEASEIPKTHLGEATRRHQPSSEVALGDGVDLGCC